MNKRLAFILYYSIFFSVTSCTTSKTEDPEPQKTPGVNYLKGKEASAGQNSTIVLKEDGTLKTLGEIKKSGDSLSGVVAISSGLDYEICLKSNGTVWTWGVNFHGQLGDGTNTDNYTPKQVPELDNIVKVAAGAIHSLALKSDGTVWAWGNNSLGQLGDSTKINKSSPVQVKGLTGVIFISAGTGHSLAIKSDGTVWGWGGNTSGCLGNAGGLIPLEITGLSNSIAIGGGNEYTIALKSDGTVWACGTNNAGQLGIGLVSSGTNTPVQISSLSDVRAIAVGHTHSLALKNDSTVWGWGYNALGSIGDGTNTIRSNPVKVSYLKGIKYIAASKGYHSVAIEGDGTVWTWGNNTASQLGISFLQTTARYSPDRVKE